MTGRLYSPLPCPGRCDGFKCVLGGCILCSVAEQQRRVHRGADAEDAENARTTARRAAVPQTSKATTMAANNAAMAPGGARGTGNRRRGQAPCGCPEFREGRSRGSRAEENGSSSPANTASMAQKAVYATLGSSSTATGRTGTQAVEPLNPAVFHVEWCVGILVYYHSCFDRSVCAGKTSARRTFHGRVGIQIFLQAIGLSIPSHVRNCIEDGGTRDGRSPR